MISKKDKMSMIFIVISIIGLGYIYNCYKNLDKDVLNCINEKTLAINKITDNYDQIKSPVIKNKIDKEYNNRMDLLKKIKASTVNKQRKLCNL